MHLSLRYMAGSFKGKGGRTKGRLWVCVGLVILCLAPSWVHCAEQALSLGYGIAAYNTDKHLGRLDGGNYYDFIRASYQYEIPVLAKRFALLMEPFASYVNRPTPGAEAGIGLGLRYYLFGSSNNGLFVTGGPGMAYTSVAFQEQGTHLLFILQGGIGYRYKDFFVENKIRHYSNGSTARPNWSVNSNIVSFGVYFE
jgi:hypothetical protein